MTWRVQFREHRTHLKEPTAGLISWEDGHSRETAAARAAEILASQDVCWVHVEDLTAPHRKVLEKKVKKEKGS